MTDHLHFSKLEAEVDEGGIEKMIRSSRRIRPSQSLLLKNPVVLSLRSGRNVDYETDPSEDLKYSQQAC
ncbi:MAG: hypothetical protein ACON5H_04360 [Akkermansiaceae bacterium]